MNLAQEMESETTRHQKNQPHGGLGMDISCVKEALGKYQTADIESTMIQKIQKQWKYGEKQPDNNSEKEPRETSTEK